jgi:RNA polymerase sigma factor for flagellar operon FliA
MEGLNSQNPFSLLRDKNTQQIVLKAIKELPEKQRIVLNLYYYDELNLKEIGKILNITESRVSQIHTTAVKRMKIKLKDIL